MTKIYPYTYVISKRVLISNICAAVFPIICAAIMMFITDYIHGYFSMACIITWTASILVARLLAKPLSATITAENIIIKKLSGNMTFDLCTEYYFMSVEHQKTENTAKAGWLILRNKRPKLALYISHYFDSLDCNLGKEIAQVNSQGLNILFQNKAEYGVLNISLASLSMLFITFILYSLAILIMSILASSPHLWNIPRIFFAVSIGFYLTAFIFCLLAGFDLVYSRSKSRKKISPNYRVLYDFIDLWGYGVIMFLLHLPIWTIVDVSPVQFSGHLRYIVLIGTLFFISIFFSIVCLWFIRFRDTLFNGKNI